MKTILIILFALNSSLVATAETWRGVHGSATTYLVSYAEEGRHFVARFEQRSGEVQERAELKSFATEQEASAFLKRESRRLRASPFTSARLNSSPSNTISVWPVTEAWSEEWEDRYSQWMEQNFTPDFFVRHNLVTDCADVPVSMRWIFARIHGLPAGNHFAGSGELFTQDSAPASWAQIPTSSNWWEDQRFLRALKAVKDNTYTGSVFYDLYPTRIEQRTLRPGAVWLINGHHTYNVGRVDLASNEVMEFYSSNVPAEVRELYVDSLMSVFYVPNEADSGFQRPRWIVRDSVTGLWRMLEGPQHAWYSREQFDSNVFGEDFGLWVINRLGGQNPPPAARFRVLVQELKNGLSDRDAIVTNGWAACGGGRCPVGSPEFEAHSTPSRDQRLRDKALQIEDLVRQNPELEGNWSYFLAEGQYIYLVEGYTYWVSYEKLIANLVGGYFSSDPNDKMHQRWGMILPPVPTGT